ncbi:glycosyltransferase family 2 protein [Acuticoccus sediminis]|uniref:glycosyltransferase family 2 protein n=1 Tax=Acuticoccus sediminis TaxID=2184697 RepID=UPI001CFE14D7|nr:glycosyltransferase family 2 protein [Acuticoccus sediminis]
MPDVSVIIAAYCAEDSIATSIASALAQDVDLEVIVVDDASPDGTAAAAEAVDDPRVRVLRLEDNGGPGVARNSGFAAATGTFIAVLDADDAFRPGRLARCLARGKDADIIIDSITIEETGRPARTLDVAEAAGGPTLDLTDYVRLNSPMARKDTLGYTKPLFRRTFLEANGLHYDPLLRIGEDYLLMAEALACGARCAVVPDAGYVYRRRAGSISARLGVRHIEAMLAADVCFEAHHTLCEEVVEAIAARRSALSDALAFAEAIEQLKARRPVSAAVAVMRRPRSAIHFRYPIGARLHRLFRGGAPEAAAS